MFVLISGFASRWICGFAVLRLAGFVDFDCFIFCGRFVLVGVFRFAFTGIGFVNIITTPGTMQPMQNSCGPCDMKFRYWVRSSIKAAVS